MPNCWSVVQSRSPELMDDPALDAHEHLAALQALGRINALSWTAAHLARSIARLVPARAPGAPPIRVVDIACGGGDVTLALARRLGPASHVIGIDMSDRAVDRAAALANRRGLGNATFTVGDVLADGCPPCDVAVTSLFLHHLDDDAAAGVLRRVAAAAALGVVVSDLLRSRRGLVLAHVATSLLTTSRVARVDGPLSVRAARTLPEYRTLLAEAGLAGARVRRVWPERVLIEWRASDRGAAR